jgi:hypothetical protein
MPIYRLIRNTVFEPADVEEMAQAFNTICHTLKITRPDERDLIARKVIKCAEGGTLNCQDICKMVLSEFQDHAASG